MPARKRSFHGASIVLVLAASTPVAAQVSVREPNATDGEIVVTAQRREERLLDVPIAITALSADTLESSGISEIAELPLVTPGLTIAGPAFAQPTIRGIGTGVSDPGNDANVAIYVNGVYQPSQTGNLFELNNIERVEVLKGPQGTLFGRNATGGAILITTADPDQDLRGRIGASYGRFDDLRADVFVNLPLGGKAAMNLSGIYKRTDGYIDNRALNTKLGGSDFVGVRGKLKLEPWPRLTLVVEGNYSDSTDRAVYSVHPINGNNVNRQAGVIFPSGFYEVALGPREPVAEVEAHGVSLTAKLDVAAGTLTSITAYQRFDTFLVVDSDNSPLFSILAEIPIDQKTFTQEVSFASEFDGPFNFTAGAFYFNDRTRSGLTSRNANGIAAQIATALDTEALSGFVEASYDLSDALTAIVGARYSTERKDAQASVTGNRLIDTGQRWNRLTPRAVLSYKLSANSSVYASWSRGFKSGAYNLTSLQPAPVEPEDIDAYEVGFKYSDGGFVFNASAFYYDYSNIQVTVQTNEGGRLVARIQNAASAESYGLDAELIAPLDPSFMLRAGFAWTHGRYKRFPGALLTFPAVDAGGVPIGGNTQRAADASGTHMIRAPEITANLTGTYSVDVAGGKLRFSATGSYNDGFYWTIGDRVRQGSYFILNARASWIDSQRRFELFGYGENLTSAKYGIYGGSSATGDFVSPARPWRAGIGGRVFF